MSKSELIEGWYFEHTANPTAQLDKHDQKDSEWLPGMFEFPAGLETASE